jgi:hypothetical protein
MAGARQGLYRHGWGGSKHTLRVSARRHSGGPSTSWDLAAGVTGPIEEAGLPIEGHRRRISRGTNIYYYGGFFDHFWEKNPPPAEHAGVGCGCELYGLRSTCTAYYVLLRVSVT